MNGQFSQWAPYLPWLVGCFFVLLACGIVLRRASTKWIKDSELLEIVSELTAVWTNRVKGFAHAYWVAAPPNPPER